MGKTLNVANTTEQANLVAVLRKALLSNSLLAGFPIEAVAIDGLIGDTAPTPYLNPSY